MSPKKRAAPGERAKPELPSEVAGALKDLLDSLQDRAEGGQDAQGGAKADPVVAQLREAGRLLQQAATTLERQRLQSRNHSGTTSKMVAAARVRHSQGAPVEARVGRLVEVASAAGLTIRGLGQAVGCSHVQIGRGVRGERAFRRSWADEIQRLTRTPAHPHGFEATPANWPGGWAREPQ